MITLDIHYFGMVAEETGKEREELQIEIGTTANELKALLNEHYPGLLRFPYRIAVNQNLVDDSYAIRTSSEIALLPAFAGG